MRFMMMHKHDPNTEAGTKPPPRLIEEMGAFVGGHMKAGRFVDGAGLGPTRTRSRLIFKNGKVTVKNGPYQGERELPAAALFLKVAVLDEAMRWAERYGRVLGDCELELGKITEPWDLGLVPEPANHPLQLLLIEKADAETEAGGRSAEKKAALTRLQSEMTKEGVLLRSYRLTPSSKGKRLNFTDNRLQTTDGPFAESKEMIGGFGIMNVGSIDEVIELAKPYTKILGGTLEIDIRPLDE